MYVSDLQCREKDFECCVTGPFQNWIFISFMLLGSLHWHYITVLLMKIYVCVLKGKQVEGDPFFTDSWILIITTLSNIYKFIHLFTDRFLSPLIAWTLKMKDEKVVKNSSSSSSSFWLAVMKHCPVSIVKAKYLSHSWCPPELCQGILLPPWQKKSGAQGVPPCPRFHVHRAGTGSASQASSASPAFRTMAQEGPCRGTDRPVRH